MESYSGINITRSFSLKPRSRICSTCKYGYWICFAAAVFASNPRPKRCEKWKKFLLAWTNYALATKLDKEDEAVQVATLLTVIEEDARDMYRTFEWSDVGDAQKIEPVLKKLGEYCGPRRNIPFERYRFNRRVQEPGETYEQYCTELRKIAKSCNFEAITPVR